MFKRFLILLALTPVLASAAGTDIKCDRAAADSGDMTAAWDCDRLEYKALDTDLNKTYSQIVAKLKALKDSKRLQALESEEKAWWKTKPRCLGPIENRQEATLKLGQCTDMTRDRLGKLKSDYADLLK